jgi:hypothetical protein
MHHFAKATVKQQLVELDAKEDPSIKATGEQR